jgi:hypothetical protein
MKSRQSLSEHCIENSYELAIVMPAFNEEAGICGAVTSWKDELTGLGINYRMILINDGSSDNTGAILDRWACDPHVLVVHKKNGGHGPTIMAGYRIAVQIATWVFQTDSDEEIKPSNFARLWDRRHGYQALLGIRRRRVQPLIRKVSSMGCRYSVHLLFGNRVEDVNVPFRLILSSVLGPIVKAIPPLSFAPNVLVSAILSLSNLRVLNIPVIWEGRKSGTTSLGRIMLLEAIFRAFLQTILFRLNSGKVVQVLNGMTSEKINRNNLL